jgi:hypothetical protein
MLNSNDTKALATMCLLWAFEFHPAKDKATGQPIFVDTDNYDIVSIIDMHIDRCRLITCALYIGCNLYASLISVRNCSTQQEEDESSRQGV